MRKTLGEIFEAHRKLIKNVDKVEHLRKHACPALFYFLQLAFNEQVEWVLPEGAPPFKQDKNPFGRTGSHLGRELRFVYLFLKGGNDGLRQTPREVRFRNMLELLHEVEVELLLSVKDKTFDKKFRCQKKIVEEAFPGLLEQPFSLRYLRG